MLTSCHSAVVPLGASSRRCISAISTPQERANLAIYDPKVAREQIYADLGKESMEKIQIEDDPYVTCAGAHAIAILTEWDAFKTLDYKRIFDSMSKPAFIFDGRNILDIAKLQAIGFNCWAVGKSLNPPSDIF